MRFLNSTLNLSVSLFIRYSGRSKFLFFLSSAANFFSSLLEAIVAVSLPTLIGNYFGEVSTQTKPQYFQILSDPFGFALIIVASFALKNYSLFVSGKYAASVSCAYLRDFCRSFYQQDIDSIKNTTKESLSSFIQGTFPLIGREVFFPSTQIISSGIFIVLLIFSAINADGINPSLLAVLLSMMSASYLLTSLFTSKKLVELGSKVKDILFSQGDLVGFLHSSSLDDSFTRNSHNYSEIIYENDLRLKKIQNKMVIFTSLPKSLTESVLLISIIIVTVAASKYSEVSLVSSSSLIGAFYILFKLLNSVQLFTRSFFLLKSNSKTLKLIESNLHIFKLNKVRDYIKYQYFTDPSLILKVYFLEIKSKAMKNKVNFEVSEGDICLLDAQSGIGKTRLIYTIAGKLEPLSGDIIFRQVSDTKRLSPVLIAQKQHLITGNVNDMIEVGSIPETVRSINEAIDRTNIDISVFINGIGIHNTIKSFLETSSHDLSGGQLQRVLILKILMSKSSLLMLDEPTSNLDLMTESRCMLELCKFVKKSPAKALIYTSHSNNAKKFATKTISLIQ